MGFIIVPTTAYPDTPLSLPHYCSFCVQDDGGGGQITINGLGVTSSLVAGTTDLKTFFTGLGLMWRSNPLLRAFRAVPAGTTTAAMNQFINNLEINSYFIAGNGVAGALGFTYLINLGSGGATTPYLSIAGPSVAGIWRVDLKLRHSITN